MAFDPLIVVYACKLNTSRQKESYIFDLSEWSFLRELNGNKRCGEVSYKGLSFIHHVCRRKEDTIVNCEPVIVVVCEHVIDEGKSAKYL